MQRERACALSFRIGREKKVPCLIALFVGQGNEKECSMDINDNVYDNMTSLEAAVWVIDAAMLLLFYWRSNCRVRICVNKL